MFPEIFIWLITCYGTIVSVVPFIVLGYRKGNKIKSICVAFSCFILIPLLFVKLSLSIYYKFLLDLNEWNTFMIGMYIFTHTIVIEISYYMIFDIPPILLTFFSLYLICNNVRDRNDKKIDH